MTPTKKNPTLWNLLLFKKNLGKINLHMFLSCNDTLVYKCRFLNHFKTNYSINK